mgnify:CR=1 FL=1
MYQLAGVDDEAEQEEEIFQTGKRRMGKRRIIPESIINEQ